MHRRELRLGLLSPGSAAFSQAAFLGEAALSGGGLLPFNKLLHTPSQSAFSK